MVLNYMCFKYAPSKYYSTRKQSQLNSQYFNKEHCRNSILYWGLTWFRLKSKKFQNSVFSKTKLRGYHCYGGFTRLSSGPLTISGMFINVKSF